MQESSIDRESYVPFYIQVIDILKEAIDNGDLSPGDQLPGEPELCRIFDVSRTVIRQALKELEFQGLIEREKGRGTFVAEPKIEEGLFQELTGFHQDMTARGHELVSEVLKQEIIAAGKKIAAYLHIEPATRVIQIDRLRFVDDEPIVFVSTFLPFDLCPALIDADLRQQSLYSFLEKRYNLLITRGKRTLEAVPANEYEAELLQVAKGAPLILLDSVSYLADGTPIEYYHALHRGDRSRFEVELIRYRDQSPAEEQLPPGPTGKRNRKI
ncbi:MAG: GntR family transcriptional regulator [Candidatus Promineifilaceae bacterium]|nr:GntR family transcriptional regulator [Candidatus Promineifilaceae bacterium]